MLAKVASCAVLGLDGAIVQVEVDINPNSLPSFTLVGLPDAAVKESAERVRAAIKNSGLMFPRGRIVVNLAPADLRKEGPAYDLPIAVGLLVASEQIPPEVDKCLFIGELSLDGTARHTNGVLSMAVAAQKEGYGILFVPQADAPEASLIEGMDVIPLDSLHALARHLNGAEPILPYRAAVSLDVPVNDGYATDFADVRGQTSTQKYQCAVCPHEIMG